MKIAAITDDGKTISQHFGRAPYYLVITIVDGEIAEKQLRNKLGHTQFHEESHPSDPPGQPHGFGPAAHERHLRMAESIADCEVLLCRGMGAGAYNSMLQRGIRPIVTDIIPIEEAALAYAEGRIVDHTELLHG
jgi:predicted Fe-Mo cluster-binding NifX family protein